MFSTPGGMLYGKGGEACARALSTSKPHMELKGHSETLYCYDAECFFVGYADIHRHLAEENDDLQQQIKHLEQAQFRLSQAVEFAKDDRKGDFWTHRADIAKDVNQRLAKAKKAADSTPQPNDTDRQAQRQTEQTRIAGEKAQEAQAEVQRLMPLEAQVQQLMQELNQRPTQQQLEEAQAEVQRLMPLEAQVQQLMQELNQRPTQQQLEEAQAEVQRLMPLKKALSGMYVCFSTRRRAGFSSVILLGVAYGVVRLLQRRGGSGHHLTPAHSTVSHSSSFFKPPPVPPQFSDVGESVLHNGLKKIP